MRKRREKKENYKKRFMNGFKILCRSKAPYTVWFDCMALFAITLANTSILPLAGYVIHDNTLIKPSPVLPDDLEKIWFTPVWVTDTWTMRRLMHGQDILGRRCSNKKWG